MSRKFTLEFKAEAIKLVTEQGYSQAAASRALGVSDKNINRWVIESKGLKTKKPASTSEHDELIRLRKENLQLKMEQEILKKAAAFFAKQLS